MKLRLGTGLAVAGMLAALAPAWSAPEVNRGQRVFGACAACHSLEPDRSMTGPSLAGLWGRKGGSLPSFSRYSSALPVLAQVCRSRQHSSSFPSLRLS
jgi:cytochrome c2